MGDLINESTSESTVYLLGNNNGATLGVKHIVAQYFTTCWKFTAMSYSSEVNVSRTLTYCLFDMPPG